MVTTLQLYYWSVLSQPRFRIVLSLEGVHDDVRAVFLTSSAHSVSVRQLLPIRQLVHVAHCTADVLFKRPS